MEPYVDVDRYLLTCNELTDMDIIDDLMQARNSAESTEADYDSNDDEPVTLPPTLTQALDACDVVRRFFETVESSEHSINLLCGVHKELLKVDLQRRCAKQTSITDFFRK
ncbi:MAG: hypothetical protein JAZ03_17435 [Candidatus Thiodiazotropha taylori]|nr:hypothetical protein [Candidatus Thiodiazotropha taylori]MCW4335710.1 hypothetical protein [Candidatus Thiodiazotropha endolucinida]